MRGVNHKEAKKRLQELITDAKSKSVRAFALSVNVDPSLMAKVLSDQRVLTDSMVNSIVDVYKINRDWLLYGTGEKYGQNGTRNVHTDLPPDTKQLYERWLADKEKTQQQFHATNQGLIDLLKNKLDEIATNLMTGQYQLKEQLFAVGESLGQQLDGISSGLAAKDRPVEQPVKKDKGVSGRQKESDGKDKSH